MKLPYKLFKLKLAISRAVHRFIICPIKGHSMDTIHSDLYYDADDYFDGLELNAKTTRVYCSNCQRDFNYYEVSNDK